MAETTVNYELTKPLPEEFYGIAVQNDNMDKIDAALKAMADATQTAQESANDAGTAAQTAQVQAEAAHVLAGEAKTAAEAASKAVENIGSMTQGVDEHNAAATAHPDIRAAVAAAVKAAENAQSAADTALETIKDCLHH